MQKQDNQTPIDDDEINLMDLLLVIAKHNRFIIKFTLLVVILATAYTLQQTSIYTANAVILPPQQAQSASSMILSKLGGLGSLAGGQVGAKSQNDLQIGMLKSRAVADIIITRFHLQQKFKAKNMEATRASLDGGAKFTSRKDGFIILEYSDKDPQFAATIANAYVDALDQLNTILAITEASRKRLFFEKQLKGTAKDLAAAEVALKQTQERTGMIQLDKQGAAIIDAVTNVRAQIAAKEVELAAMGSFATPQNPDYLQIQHIIIGLRAQLAKVERDHVAGQGDVMVPTGKLPETGLEFLRKMRELKYQETLFEMLSQQFELAKIDEAKEAALIQVVDKAEVPERRSSPKRAQTVVFASMMAFFIGILLAFFKEASERARLDSVSIKRMSLLRRYLRHGTWLAVSTVIS